MPKEITPDQEIWVITSEGAEITGYSQEYLEQLARKNRRLPEDERVIKLRKRAGRYDLWLPDLLRYIEEIGNGPHHPVKK
jgi:AAA+ ATPase superfamily predicted ATPase